jgi:predicted nucleic acid binding AN1-type Zn finger protein
MEFANHSAWKHCEAPLCNQLDFLPFHCADCGNTFCAEHREWKEHNCAAGLHKLQGRVVDTCTDCGRVVPQLQNKTMAESMALHCAAGGNCDGHAKKSKKKKKKTANADGTEANNSTSRPKRERCAVRRCKEDIRASYKQFHCRECHNKFCVKHRLALEHDCRELRAAHYEALAKDARAKSRATVSQQNAASARDETTESGVRPADQQRPRMVLAF